MIFLTKEYQEGEINKIDRRETYERHSDLPGVSGYVLEF